MSDDLIKREDAIKAMEQRYQDILRIFKRKVKDGEKAIALDMIGCIKSLPSADRPRAEWIFHYRDKWIVKAECPKCHRRFEFSPRAIWKCCPMCETRMKGADDE